MPSTKKTFRLFVSSTFSDMGAERGILQRDVFPELKSFCQARGADFQAIDLRWGVSEETQLDQKTMRLCLGEIERCQLLSPRPNFLVLLGDRYGWEPLPEAIPSREMEQILEVVSAEGRGRLELWYKEDLNADPAEYVLLPRKGEYAVFARWEEESGGLLAILRRAVDVLPFSEAQRIKYFTSATHQEINRAVFEPSTHSPSPEEHVLACFRSHGDPAPVVGVDASREKLEGLKARLRDFLPGDHQCDYRGSLPPGKAAFTLDDEKAFAEWVLDHLRHLIEGELEKAGAGERSERDLHNGFQKKLCADFTGREQGLKRVEDYLHTPGGKILLLSGPGGSGKSSVMAEAARRTEGPGTKTLLRFIGLTSVATDPESLVNSICLELAECLGRTFDSFLEDEDGKEPDLHDPRMLRKFLVNILAAVPEGKPVALFLDALDQVEGGARSTLASMLPSELPASVCIVASALPEWEAELEGAEVFRLDAMPEREGQELLRKWLSNAKRKLQGEQEAAILGQFAVHGLPLHLRLAFEKARETRSFEPFVPGATIEEALSSFFDCLEEEHGLLLVRKAVSFLLAGRHGGLKEEEIVGLLHFDTEYWKAFVAQSNEAYRGELEHALSLPVAVWSRFHLDLEPYLAERDAEGESVLAFFHRQFREYAEKRYGADLRATHDVVARFFEDSPLYFDKVEHQPNRRKATEQAWQEMRAGRWEELEKLSLGNFAFVMMKFKAELGEQAIGEYRAIEKEAPAAIKTRMQIWSAFFREKAHILRRGNGEWPGYKTLLQLAVEHSDDSPLTIGAERWLEEGKCDWRWIARIQRLTHAGNSNIVAILEGHTDWITSVLELADGRLASSSDDRTIRLWNPDGKLLRVIKTGHDSIVSGLLERSDGTFISWSRRSDVRIWSKDGDLLSVLERPHLKEAILGSPLFNDIMKKLPDMREHISKDVRKVPLLLQEKDNKDERIPYRFDRNYEGFLCTNFVIELSDGRLLVFYKDEAISLWDASSGLLKYHARRDMVSEQEILERILIREAEGKTSCNGDGEICLGNGCLARWESKNNRITIVDPAKEGSGYLPGHDNYNIDSNDNAALVNGIVLSRLGTELISWSEEGEILAELVSLSDYRDHDDENFVVAYGEKSFAYVPPSKACIIVSDPKGKAEYKLKRPAGQGKVIGFAPMTKGRLLSWYSDDMVILWGTDGKPELSFEAKPSGENISENDLEAFEQSVHQRPGLDGAYALKDGGFATWKYSELRFWSMTGEPWKGQLNNKVSDRSLDRQKEQYRNTLKGKNGLIDEEAEIMLGFLATMDNRNHAEIVSIFPIIDHFKQVNGVAELMDGSIVSWDNSGKVMIRNLKNGTLEEAMVLPGATKVHVFPDDSIAAFDWDGNLAWYSDGEIPGYLLEDALLDENFRDAFWGAGSAGKYFFHSGEKAGVRSGSSNSIGSRCLLACAELEDVNTFGIKSMAVWHALAPCSAKYLKKDGRMLATQDDGQVCFLRLYQGNQMIALDGTPTQPLEPLPRHSDNLLSNP